MRTFPHGRKRNFYPRPPRGGRPRRRALRVIAENFYPRPPRGGRPRPRIVFAHESLISIHALREEGDLRMLLNSALISLFLSTPSARRATLPSARTAQLWGDFYPRPPRGGRLWQTLAVTASCYFYPRPPRGGRRYVVYAAADSQDISIHALREEGDISGANKYL